MPLLSLLVIMLLPSPGPRYYPIMRGGQQVGTGESWYWGFHARCHKKVVTWHRVELEKLDYDFRFEQSSLRLVKARREAHEAGIEPMNP